MVPAPLSCFQVPKGEPRDGQVIAAILVRRPLKSSWLLNGVSPERFYPVFKLGITERSLLTCPRLIRRPFFCESWSYSKQLSPPIFTTMIPEYLLGNYQTDSCLVVKKMNRRKLQLRHNRPIDRHAFIITPRCITCLNRKGLCFKSKQPGPVLIRRSGAPAPRARDQDT